MPKHPAKILGRANRLRVFALVRHTMIFEGRCPDGQEIADKLGLAQSTASAHLNALRRADGLPLPIPLGGDRKFNVGEAARDDDILHGRMLAGLGRIDPGSPVEVDLLFGR